MFEVGDRIEFEGQTGTVIGVEDSHKSQPHWQLLEIQLDEPDTIEGLRFVLGNYVTKIKDR